MIGVILRALYNCILDSTQVIELVVESTWTQKVGNIMAFMAIIMGLGYYFAYFSGLGKYDL